MTQWLGIRYRDFWDVPRMVAIDFEDTTYVLDSRFDDTNDEWSNFFTVYRVSRPVPPDGTWDTVLDGAIEIGRLAVDEVTFDSTKRRALDASVLQTLLHP